jgi:hypothetical protein
MKPDQERPVLLSVQQLKIKGNGMIGLSLKCQGLLFSLEFSQKRVSTF